jgi:serine/threonine-protein kinase ATR
MYVADLRKELCESESGSFSDPQLSIESTSIIETFRALNVGDESRPAKRQKTLAEDITQRPVPNLSSLRKTIQFSCSLLA